MCAPVAEVAFGEVFWPEGAALGGGEGHAAVRARASGFPRPPPLWKDGARRGLLTAAALQVKYPLLLPTSGRYPPPLFP